MARPVRDLIASLAITPASSCTPGFLWRCLPNSISDRRPVRIRGVLPLPCQTARLRVMVTAASEEVPAMGKGVETSRALVCFVAVRARRIQAVS